MIRMPDGTRWATISDAAQSQRVRPGTIRVWVHRDLVRSHKVLGRTYVCLDDVADAEVQWRRRAVR